MLLDLSGAFRLLGASLAFGGGGGGGSDAGFLGVFADIAALTTAHPTAVTGSTATVTSPDGNLFFYNSAAWVDTGTGFLGDMLKAVYDPTAVNADAFSMGSMVETAAAKILTNLERAAIAANSSKVSNVTTNLSVGTATDTTLVVESSDGSNATLPQAVAATSAGLLSGTDKEKINGGWSKTVFSSYKVGTTADPSTTAETPATAPVLAEMTHTFTPAKATNVIKVQCGCSFDKTGGGDDGVRMAVFVDGVVQTETTRRNFVASNDDYNASLHTFWRGSLSVAAHTIDVRFWGTDDTMIAVDVERNFFIEEIDTI